MILYSLLYSRAENGFAFAQVERVQWLFSTMGSNGNDFEFNTKPNGLSKINTKATPPEMCKDDTAPTVKVTNLEELHALQRKKASAPSTPRNATPKSLTPRSLLSEEERQKQQMKSVRFEDFPFCV